MEIQSYKNTLESKMKKSLEVLTQTFSKVRTGRANTSLLDLITVDYYGSQVPVNQVANITVIDAKTLGVQVWEKPMVATVEKAIRESDLGLNPQSQGELLRIPLPALTEERRLQLVKTIKSEGENAKVSVRNIRRDGNDQIKKALKDKTINEDDEKRLQDVTQKLTDDYIAQIDEKIKLKETDITSL